MLICVPFGVGAILFFDPSRGLSGASLLCAILFPAVGWLSLNWLGLWGNESMRRQVTRLYERTEPPPDWGRIWVGAARPAFRGVLDPHEEVGFLILRAEELEFFSETVRLKLPKSTLKAIRTGVNPHSLVGLGGWVVLVGEIDGQPILFRVEPRESPTLWGNVRQRRRLRDTLTQWLKSEGSEPPQSGSDPSAGGVVSS